MGAWRSQDRSRDRLEPNAPGVAPARRAEPSVSDLVDVNYHRAIAIGAALAPVALVEIGSLEIIDKQPLVSDELAVFEKHLDPRAGSRDSRDANLDTGQLGRQGGDPDAQPKTAFPYRRR